MGASLEQHMRRAVTTYGHDRIELEWRLGHRQGNFRPGVGTDAWRRLQHALDTSPHFQKTFVETVEKLGDVPGVKCIHHVASQEDVWMHKKRLADVDAESDSAWSIRASVSLEELEEHPAPGQLKYERRKRRWSYRHKCWSIDLTQVCSNLPHDLDEDRETHEVEVELVDQGVLFERPVAYIVEWGWDLARDMCAIMSGSPCKTD